MALQIGDRFCALSENQLAGVSSGCRWPMPEVGIFQAMDLSASGIAPADIQRVLAQICEDWNAVGHLSLHPAASASAANIFTQSGRIDGLNGVLGQSYLPCGNVGPTTQLAQLLDNGEHWTLDMLLRVWLHELGHAIGLEHAPQGSGACMEPFLTSYTKPQPWDIQQIQLRYPGPPIAIPAPTPTPDDPSGDDVFGKGVIINIPKPGNYLFRITLTPR